MLNIFCFNDDIVFDKIYAALNEFLNNCLPVYIFKERYTFKERSHEKLQRNETCFEYITISMTLSIGIWGKRKC